jgi:GMP synthase-like glutamine amidotransferase
MGDQGQNEAAASSDGSRPLRIAIINCPGSERYDDCFKTWLRPEATGQRIEWEVFEAAEGQLPPESGGDGFDGYIITGSKHGVYEDFPWIQQLCDWVAQAHARRSKILGVCFGHQVGATAVRPPRTHARVVEDAR